MKSKMKVVKETLVLVALLSCTMNTSAQLIIDYKMNDPSGTTSSGLQNDGTDSGSISGNAQGVATDGSGNLHYAGLTANSSKSHVLDTTYSSGILQLTYRISAWDYTGNAASDGISFSLWNSTDSKGLKAMVDFANNGTDTRIRVSGPIAGKQKLLAGQLSGTDLIIRAIANFDADTYSAEYNLGGAGWTSIASDEVLGVSSIDEFRLITDGTPSWGAGSSVDVDYATVEVVPEPSTVGLMAVAATALFLARNKRQTPTNKIIRQIERELGY
jgi:hypothetical protein